jgi:hypothetical protein
VIRTLGLPCRQLAPRLAHVQLDGDALRALAAELLDAPPPAPSWDHPAMPDEPGPLLDAVVWLGNALNFCYWVPEGEPMWAVPVAGRPEVDAIGLLGALHGAARDGVDLGDARWLVQQGPDGPAAVFSRGEGTLPLRQARVDILAELGRVLLARFDGRLEHAVAAAGDDAVGMARFLAAQFPSFVDQRCYRGHTLPFLKRAQLTAAMLHIRRRALGGTGLAGTDRLTAFADYMLPRALRGAGVLRYAPALAARVDGRATLEAHSAEECELRIATVAACEDLLEAMRAQGAAVDAVVLDHWLWRMGQGMGAPHHRVLTTDY